MTQTEIDKYRETIDTQLKEKVTEIESNISLLILGSLGFFLTINEKFIRIKDSSLKFILVLSILLLLTSFGFFLYNKHLTTKYDKKIIDFLDNEMQPNDKKANAKLLNMWTHFDNRLSLNRNILYLALFIGITLQIIYFVTNVMKQPSNEVKNKTEIFNPSDSISSKIINK